MAGTSITFSDFQPRLTDALSSLGLSERKIASAHKRGLTAMGAWMVREMRKGIENYQGQPGGDKWKPLNDKYATRKQQDGRSDKIGIYTGRMQNSFSFDVRQGRGEVESGPTVSYAEYFDNIRPLTPKDAYASSEFADIMIDAYKKVSR